MRHRRRPVCPWRPSLSDSRQYESEMLSEALIPEWGNRSCWRLRGCLVVSSSCLIEPHTFFTNHSWRLIQSLLHSCRTISELKYLKCLSAKSLWQQRHIFFCLSRIYYWYDEKGKKTKCTAPQYVDFVMSLCQKLVTDEEIFPTKYGESSCGSSGGEGAECLFCRRHPCHTVSRHGFCNTILYSHNSCTFWF